MRAIRLWRGTAVLALVPAAACALALCTVRSGATPQQPAPAGTAATIAGLSFQPAKLFVDAGTTITWTNRDDIAHTVTASDGTAFDSGPIPPGGGWSYTFARGGIFPYFCSIHPLMSGSVLVRGGGVAVSPAGAGIVSAPGGMVPASRILAFDPVANAYTDVSPRSPLQPGAGYWATFDDDSAYRLPPGNTTPAQLSAPAGRWLLIGNPSARLAATVSGADAMYTFDTLAGTYAATFTLLPGQGAWALSSAGGTIVVAPGGVAATPSPAATATAPVATPPSATPVPSPSASASATPSPSPTPSPTPTPVPRPVLP